MLTKLTGKVVLSAAGAVTSKTGIGYTVVKQGTGLYRFTLDDSFFEVQGIFPSLVEVTPTTLSIKAKTNYTNIITQKLGFFELQIINTSAVATDVSAVSEIHFEVNLKNTSVPL